VPILQAMTLGDAATRCRLVAMAKAPVGATDPVLNIVHRLQVTAPTGAFAMATRRHLVAASPSVIACKMGTG